MEQFRPVRETRYAKMPSALRLLNQPALLMPIAVPMRMLAALSAKGAQLTGILPPIPATTRERQIQAAVIQLPPNYSNPAPAAKLAVMGLVQLP